MTVPCLCCSGKTFDECCNRFLSGQQSAKTPEQLMRSRFSAYALGGYGEYLMKTWLPLMARNLTALELNERTQDWQRLEILDKLQKGDSGEVEFNAFFNNETGQEECMHERSSFKRIKGHWYYVGGIIAGGKADSSDQ